ncbi:MAG: fructose-6-phosphate aldolase [Deltaproteobacteria bacterium]|nr:fructose-6-phosphate aldolase [Deltaproteobacteria bacterium]
MKIFIDSADVTEIRDAVSLGVVDGVTTNPSLVAKTGRPLAAVIREICEIVDGPISAEVIATDAQGMIREARELAAIHPNVVIKVPLIAEGLRAIKSLISEGIRANATLCFSAPQALLAAKAGARYISPFLGRIDDVGGDGLELISQIVTIYRNYEYSTEVLAASIRHPVHLVRCAELGADVCTIPYKVILQLLSHPLTDVGLSKFLKDAKKTP